MNSLSNASNRGPLMIDMSDLKKLNYFDEVYTGHGRS